MLRTLFAIAVGLVVAVTVGLLLPNQMSLWVQCLGVVVGAAITGLMIRCRQWLFGALVGVMLGGLLLACTLRLFASFKRFYGMQPDYHHAYLVVAAHTLCYAIIGAAAAEAAPKVRSMLRR
ncbi:MAG: hypothetical protein GX139_10630 [Armatimonadetes bacterium]|jgi:hypothetical protein|nr:hypothetical protein [Armatimonadota bacterium]